MSSYEQFIAQYSSLNVVRNETGGLSIAGRTSERILSEHTTDIDAVWLGYDEGTRTDTDLRVSITKMAGVWLEARWLIDPLNARLETETQSTPHELDAVRTVGLVGISALKAYLQLPQPYQRRVGWIIEDNSLTVDGSADLPPEVMHIQELAERGNDPSAAECLALFDYALSTVQNPQSFN